MYYRVNHSSDKITKIMVENLTSYIILNKAHLLWISHNNGNTIIIT